MLPRRLSHASRQVVRASTTSAVTGSVLARHATAAAAAPAQAGRRFPGPITHNQYTKHMTGALGQLSPVIVDHAEGSYIYGKDGKKYLDFCCGIGVTNLGHCHPKVHTRTERKETDDAHVWVMLFLVIHLARSPLFRF